MWQNVRSLSVTAASNSAVQLTAKPTEMRKLHLTFGIFVLAAFLLTGQYMDKYYNHMSGVPDGPRMLYRTRHVFILLAGLLNLGVAAYITPRVRLWRATFQALGSGLICLGALLFIAAFFYEPGLRDLYTPLSHWGTYTTAAGVVLHLLSGVGREEATGSQRRLASDANQRTSQQ